MEQETSGQSERWCSAGQTRLPGKVLLLIALLQGVTGLYFVLNRASASDAAWQGFPLDDAWIHLVYARSLAETGILAYNPGIPATGSTSPLWAYCLAPVCWLQGLLGGPLPLWTKGLGTLLGVLCSRELSLILLRLTGHLGLALAGGCLLALDPSFTFARVSGMEVPLAAFCALLSARAFLEQRPRILSLGLALAPLARPELAVLSGLLGGLAIWSSKCVRTRLFLLLPSLAAALLWVGFCLAATDHPLPATFYVKHGADGGGIHSAELALLFGPMLLSQVPFALGSGLLLSVLGGRWLVQASRGGALQLPVQLPMGAAGVLLGWLPLWGLALAWAHPFGEWWPFYWVRYLLPGYPLALVPVLLGGWSVWNSARAWVRLGGRALALCPLLFLPLRLPSSAELYSWNCQNIREVQEATGEWLRLRVRPGDSVAVQDAGAARFWLPPSVRVIDLVGLNSLEVQTHGAEAVLKQEQPRFLVFFPALIPHWLRRPGYREVVRLSSPHYSLMTAPQEQMVIMERQ